MIKALRKLAGLFYAVSRWTNFCAIGTATNETGVPTTKPIKDPCSQSWMKFGTKPTLIAVMAKVIASDISALIAIAKIAGAYFPGSFILFSPIP